MVLSALEADKMPKFKTPLYPAHLDSHAKLFTFCDWFMPLHYGSAMREHHMVRTDAGMFDLSCMTVIDVKGIDAQDYLQYLLANDVTKLTQFGQQQYSLMLNEQGGVEDDLTVYFINPNYYRLIFNTASFEKTLQWMRSHSTQYDVFIERKKLGMLAIVGPTAIANTQQNLTSQQIATIDLMQSNHGQFVGDDDFFIAKIQLLGEQALLLVTEGDNLETLWNDLLKQRVQPCGMLAFDTLRIESGIKQYSHEFDHKTLPLGLGLSAVCFDNDTRMFIGRNILQEHLTDDQIHVELRGVVLQENGVITAGQCIETDKGNGIVTSGCFSPTLNQSIAIARVPLNASPDVRVDVRGKTVAAKLYPLPFVQLGNVLIGESYVGHSG